MWVFIIAAQGYIGVCRRTLWPNPVLLMSVDALLKLRADVEAALSRRAKELESQLSRLGGEIDSRGKTRTSSLKGRKVAVKYRDKSRQLVGREGSPTSLASGQVKGRR